MSSVPKSLFKSQHNMKTFLVLCLALAAVSAETALRVKWGVPLLSSDIFIEIPRDEADIISDGWELVTRPSDAPLQALKMYCSNGDVTFCVMYDDTGYIAGLQVAIEKTQFTDIPYSFEDVGISSWTYEDVDYWTNQQYFVSEESLSLTAEEREEYRSAADYPTLAEGSLWLVGSDGNLKEVSTVKSELPNDGFNEQTCVLTMGIHYYYNMTSANDCSAVYPWFGLVSYEELIGSGFVAFGNYSDPSDSKRMWFERPSRALTEYIVSNAPECLYDLSTDPGIITLHIFYTKQIPLTIGC